MQPITPEPVPRDTAEKEARWTPWRHYFFLAILALAILLTLLGNYTREHNTAAIERMTVEGWPVEARLIVRNKIIALWHAAVMAFTAAAAAWYFLRRRHHRSVFWRTLLPWILVGIVAADAYRLSRNYIKTLPSAFYRENSVVSFLKDHQGLQRVAIMQSEPFIDIWTTYLFPYHGIRTFGAMSGRLMAANMMRLLDALADAPERLYQLSAVGYALAPTAAIHQWQDGSASGQTYAIVHTYDVAYVQEHGGDAVVTIPPPEGQDGAFAIARFNDPAPRYVLLQGWQAATDEQILERLADPAQPLWQHVGLPPDDTDGLPPPAGNGIVGTIQVIEHAPGRVRLRAQTPVPAVLRIADAYDPHWQATVDGNPARLLRGDFMFQALPLAAGEHEIVLVFAPPSYSLIILGAGTALCLAALMMIIINRQRHSIVPCRRAG